MAAPFAQLDGERGAFARLPGGRDAALVQLDQLLCQGQANSGATIFSRAGHIHLKETFEYPLVHLRREPRPVVAHLDPHVLVAGVLESDPNMTAGVGELAGVGEQVDEHALDALEVAPND